MVILEDVIGDALRRNVRRKVFYKAASYTVRAKNEGLARRERFPEYANCGQAIADYATMNEEMPPVLPRVAGGRQNHSRHIANPCPLHVLLRHVNRRHTQDSAPCPG